MTQEHTYTTTITWTGNKGAGTVTYDAYEAMRLHTRANEMCYIARSASFPVHHEPEIVPGQVLQCPLV